MGFFEGPRGCPFSFTVIVSQSCVKQTGFQAGLAGLSDQGRAEWIHMLLERMFKPFRINLLVN